MLPLFSFIIIWFFLLTLPSHFRLLWISFVLSLAATQFDSTIVKWSFRFNLHYSFQVGLEAEWSRHHGHRRYVSISPENMSQMMTEIHASRYEISLIITGWDLMSIQQTRDFVPAMATECPVRRPAANEVWGLKWENSQSSKVSTEVDKNLQTSSTFYH